MIKQQNNSINRSIGEEMMEWAEKYWLIDKVCKNEIGSNEGEAFSWKAFRSAFVQGIDAKVDELINPIEPPQQEFGSIG